MQGEAKEGRLKGWEGREGRSNKRKGQKMGEWRENLFANKRLQRKGDGLCQCGPWKSWADDASGKAKSNQALARLKGTLSALLHQLIQPFSQCKGTWRAPLCRNQTMRT